MKPLKIYHDGDTNCPEDAVRIDGDSVYANPYQDGTLLDALNMFREHVKFMCDFDADYLDGLKGKNLRCSCRRKKCHGLILLEVANPPEQLVLTSIA